VGGLAHALGVGVDPRLGQRDRVRPEGLDGGADAGVGGGVDGSLDAEVPLDAGLERGAREVAAADERDAEARRLEQPALGMKRAFGAVCLRGLDHAHAELAARGQVGCFVTGVGVALAPHEEQAEGVDLIEGEVVAGHDAELGPGAQRSGDPLVQELEAGLGHERGDDGDLRRGREEGPEVLAQGVVLAARREGRLAVGDRFAEAGDDGDVSVRHHVLGDLSCREQHGICVPANGNVQKY
jgi:hypothetical protein